MLIKQPEKLNTILAKLLNKPNKSHIPILPVFLTLAYFKEGL